jgi:hypothetical protein
MSLRRTASKSTGSAALGMALEKDIAMQMMTLTKLLLLTSLRR